MALKTLTFIGLALGLGAGFTLWRAGRNEDRAEASHPPIGELLNVGGTQVHAVVTGQGPDLVLIHGTSGNTRDMLFSLAPKLAKRYRVIIFDRPGMGYTDRMRERPETIRAQADLLRKAAQQLGAEKPIVVGHSFGGAVALAWAVDHTQALSALVTLAAPSHPWTTPLALFYRITSSYLGNLFVVPLLTAFATDEQVRQSLARNFLPQVVPEGYQDYVGTGLALRRTSLRANAAQRASLLGEIKELHGSYPQISVPTEILHGEADTTVILTVHAERLVEDVPEAVFTRLAGLGHMLQQVAQSDVIAAIDRAASRAGLR